MSGQTKGRTRPACNSEVSKFQIQELHTIIGCWFFIVSWSHIFCTNNLTCKFHINCTNKLCSFRHPIVPEVEQIEENSDNHNESGENDIMDESCESCGEMFDDIEDLIDHYSPTGHLQWRRIAYIRPWWSLTFEVICRWLLDFCNFVV